MTGRLPTDPKPGNLSVVLRLLNMAAAVGAIVIGCGPSVSSIYEGNIRFEHCYRLDLDPNIAPSHREACWREWTSRYTYGQTRDRLDYARRRIARLTAGDPSRPQLNLSRPTTAKPGDPTPAPVSARKAPPATATSPSPDAGAPPVDSAGGPNIPGASCAEKCKAALNTCKPKCQNAPDAGNVPCEPCATDYRQCMRRCFE